MTITPIPLAAYAFEDPEQHGLCSPAWPWALGLCWQCQVWPAEGARLSFPPFLPAPSQAFGLHCLAKLGEFPREKWNLRDRIGVSTGL